MWFLLLIIAVYNQKNYIQEFSDLYEILYKDDEILPNPDLSTINSVVKLAPLSICNLHFFLLFKKCLA